MKNKGQILNMVLSALFAAMIAVFVAWLFHIPVVIGSHSAYIHFGDAFIFLAASLLPTPYAVAAAGIGGALGDVFCGAPHWAPFTLIIKILVALMFTARGEKVLCRRNLLAVIPVMLITVGGYYLAEAVIAGNLLAPIVSVWGNVVQVIGSMAIYIALGAAAQRLKIKQLLK